jgi:hypothetical protein
MSHKGRLSKLEQQTPPAAITWKDFVDWAQLDPAGLERYQEANPEKSRAIKAHWQAVLERVESEGTR